MAKVRRPGRGFDAPRCCDLVEEDQIAEPVLFFGVKTPPKRCGVAQLNTCVALRYIVFSNQCLLFILGHLTHHCLKIGNFSSSLLLRRFLRDMRDFIPRFSFVDRENFGK